jgi:[ribosomal protein S5]-alanine N-acetyltransferase
MNRILETRRLMLNEFTLEDAEFIIQLLNSPGWIKFIGDRNVKTKQDAMNYLQTGPLKSYIDHGFGLYRVALKNTNQPIGMCGLLKRETLQFPDIGFAFLPEYGGYGYATEATTGVLKFARQVLNLSSVLAITLPDNAKSINLLSTLDFTFVEELSMPANGDTLHLYRNGRPS